MVNIMSYKTGKLSSKLLTKRRVLALKNHRAVPEHLSKGQLRPCVLLSTHEHF
jgi:hypothetical protein